jgi:hypothetical protein
MHSDRVPVGRLRVFVKSPIDQFTGNEAIDLPLIVLQGVDHNNDRLKLLDKHKFWTNCTDKGALSLLAQPDFHHEIGLLDLGRTNQTKFTGLPIRTVNNQTVNRAAAQPPRRAAPCIVAPVAGTGPLNAPTDR